MLSRHSARALFAALSLCAVVSLAPTGGAALGSDWPMWGFDAARSDASPAALDLPETLHLQWTLELPPPRRAWRQQLDDRGKLDFDKSYSPIALGGRLFVASMTNDSLTS